MDRMIKCAACVVALYFILNWLADNPRTINKARNTVNDTVTEIANPDKR